MVRGGVHDDARLFVTAHKFRHGDLDGEVVHGAQICGGGVQPGLEIGGDGLARLQFLIFAAETHKYLKLSDFATVGPEIAP